MLTPFFSAGASSHIKNNTCRSIEQEQEPHLPFRQREHMPTPYTDNYHIA
jgi:hypothetical protein